MNAKTIVKKYLNSSLKEMKLGLQKEIDLLAKKDENHKLQYDLHSFIVYLEFFVLPNEGPDSLRPFLPLLEMLVHNQEVYYTALEDFPPLPE